MALRHFCVFMLAAGLVALHAVTAAAGFAPYDMGSPTLTDLYVSTNGSDSNSGISADQPLQTLTAAWDQIPRDAELSGTGYRILVMPGTYPLEATPGFWEARYGTFQFPVIIEAANGPDTAYLPPVNFFDMRYLYLINLNIENDSDPLHCERCDHVLVRGSRFKGAEPETYNTQETIKFNQSQYVYFESNDISGAWDNAVDFVAVQYGHFFGNRIHNSGDWCMYLKGGSAYFLVSGNEYYDCGTGGFTAGQGTGFQYMVEPWLQYEAYDIKFVNNLIHDTRGAGVGVQGGYNILFAYNTLYHIGERSHLLEFGFGLRTCDGSPGDEGRERCDTYRAAGGWGNNVVDDGTLAARIPNRNVFVYNNVVVNPPGFQSAYQHLSVFAPADAVTQADSNAPANPRADENLQIRGNVIWNGDLSMPLGVEPNTDFPAGCPDDNPTCNAVQLTTDNAINQFEPQFVDAANGNFALLEPLNVTATFKQPIPDFTWDVSVPEGDVSNQIASEALPAGTLFTSAEDDSSSALEPTTVPETTGGEAEATSDRTAQPVNTSPLPPGPVTLVTLGDSLTEGAGDEQEKGGYPGRLIGLIDAVRPGSTVVNLGHSGWNSDALITGDQGLPPELDQAVSAIQTAVSSGQPALALLWVGSNDLFYLYEYSDPDSAGEQADLDHYGANLDTILSRLTGAGARVVIAQLDDQSLRPVTQAGAAFPGTSKAEVVMMSEQVRRYNKMIADKASQYGVFVVDFYNTSIFTDAATLDYDGNHPNAAGYDVVTSRWFAVIEPLLGQ